jgi:hypothetical protein
MTRMEFGGKSIASSLRNENNTMRVQKMLQFTVSDTPVDEELGGVDGCRQVIAKLQGTPRENLASMSVSRDYAPTLYGYVGRTV